jgi:multidrug resistance efflux pump
MTHIRRVHVYAMMGLIALVFSAGGAVMLAHGPRAGAAADTLADRDAPLPRVVCFGHVDAEEGIASLYPLVAGRVTAVPVRENTEVKAGAELVRLDDEIAQLRVREAEADCDAAREQRAQADKLQDQHRLKLAQQKAAIEAIGQRLAGGREIMARKRELEKGQHVSPREVRAAEALVKELEAVQRAENNKLEELNLNDPDAAIRRAQAELDAKQSRLEQARRGVKECTLTAPADGLALRVLVRPGEVLGPQPRQPAVLFCPMGPRIVRAEIEQEYAGKVALGQVASVQDDTTASMTWRGKVVRISDWYTHRRSVLQEPFQFNDVRTLECIVALDKDQPNLRIGQRVRVVLGQGQ